MTRRLGRYELLHMLGRGGGGEVWEAVLHGPAGFRRSVAVKLLREGASAPGAHEALLQEARLGALVSHPNVVGTLEVGEEDGSWFLVMDLVHGQSAESLARASKLPPGALLDLAVQVCDGLSHIHGLCDQDGWPLGLVHRDIKPANLMIDMSHRVRIVDLGIARLLGTPEVPAGTPGFLPPEQLVGEEDRRSDVFALGVTLSYLAIGVLPFGRGRMAMARVADTGADAFATDVDWTGTLDAYLPGLGHVLSRAVRADPERRWPNARALSEALQLLYASCASSPRLGSLVIERRSEEVPSTRSGLTAERGDFVGRSAEQAALNRLVDGQAPWVVVVGTGGVGKTRLIDQVTRSRPSVRCDASKAATAVGLCHAVADALGGTIGSDPGRGVARLLAENEVRLLILDEIERSVDAAVELVPVWLDACDGLRVLCSSRVAPSDPRATLVRLGPLSLRDGCALFEQRLGASGGEAVAPLIQALDRLPLGIELAAARARKTSPEQVLAQLRASSSSQVPTLRDALLASWALLTEADHRALVLLTGFSAEFDVQDAVAVLDAGSDALARLERLVDHSMLHVRKNRFRLLTSIRDFARGQLPIVCEVADKRHGQWMARFGEGDDLPALYQSTSAARPLIDALDDLLVASRLATIRGDEVVAVATTLAASQALLRVGPMTAVEPLVERVLPFGLRLDALHSDVGRALYSMGRPADAEVALIRALDASVGPARARVMVRLGGVQSALGRAGALEMLHDAVNTLERAGDGFHALAGRLMLGHSLFMQNRIADAEEQLRHAVGIGRRHGIGMGHALGTLGAVRRRRGAFVEAVALYREAIEQVGDGDQQTLLGVTLVNASSLFATMGQFAEAEAMAQQARRIGRAVGRKTTEGIACSVLSHVAMARGDLALAKEYGLICMKVSAEAADHNLECEALFALAKPLLLLGEPGGLDVLTRAWALKDRVDGEVRADLARWFARFAEVKDAQAVIDLVFAETSADDGYSLAQCYLAVAEVKKRLGRVQEARGALLQGTAELTALGLPDEAPLSVAYARVRWLLVRQ